MTKEITQEEKTFLEECCLPDYLSDIRFSSNYRDIFDRFERHVWRLGNEETIFETLRELCADLNELVEEAAEGYPEHRERELVIYRSYEDESENEH